MNAQELKSLADAQFDRAQQRKIIKESAYAARNIAHNGGLFFADLVTITFLETQIAEKLILEDLYQNPIQVDRQKLLNDLKSAYHHSMHDWYEKFEASNKIRRGANV